ncbi:GNAT family N-acetyltransferase [Methylocystis sp. JR02]|uniref:GNAT family N-acetyltransferase n=1 Tax=Methylocystis sp. JR02 TaxID=3046284 RepID=UPI0024BB672A|nr:GNAT family N-acetyltransferase [Methylocystis sp. JR02]MDJ0448745.1 GNAT family N-acetyltransferase [Methylocystis sp. JR02]
MTPPSAPAPLGERHDVAQFDCGVAVLNDWLQRRARANQLSGASRTFVVCRDERVVGYYALAAGAIASNEAPGRLRRNMPDPIPVFVLGRLAVDLQEQGRMLGSLLLRDAVIRTRAAAEFGGVAGLLVHALSEDAKRFYMHRGFSECPSNTMTLVARLKDITE